MTLWKKRATDPDDPILLTSWPRGVTWSTAWPALDEASARCPPVGCSKTLSHTADCGLQGDKAETQEDMVDIKRLLHTTIAGGERGSQGRRSPVLKFKQRFSTTGSLEVPKLYFAKLKYREVARRATVHSRRFFE